MATPWERYAQQPTGGQGLVISDPYRAAEERRQAEDQEMQRRQLELQQQQAANQAALNEIRIVQGQRDLRGAEQEEQTDAVKREAKTISDRMKYGNVMEAVRTARQIAQSGGTGWGSLLSGLPASNARALNSQINTLKANLSFDRLGEMRSDPDNKTGGALGNVTERELDLLGAVVADLDTGLDRNTFLQNLGRVERHFASAQLAMSGIDPYSEDGTRYFKEFGINVPEGGLRQAGLDEGTQAQDLPPEMQAEYASLLSEWQLSPDPDTYARMRSDLDRKYGFEPDYARYRSWAEDVAIPGLREGGTLGASLPPAEQPLEGLDWLLNAATAEPTGTGAFLAGMGNAGGAGIPTLLAGRDRMEAIRGQSPTASMLGEIAGGVTGAMATGAIGRGIGSVTGNPSIASLLSNPLASDVAYGTVYGATQAEDPLYGAVTGAGGAYLGNRVGGAIARELPGLVGLGGAVRRADESVPTNQQLRDQAADLYTQAEATGSAVDPDATTEMLSSARNILAGEGQVTPRGRVADAYPKVRTAFNLLEDYSGSQMTPDQVQSVRRALSDAAGSMDASESRIGTMMLRDFDERVNPFVPGLEDARSVAARYLNDDQITQAIDLADPRASQYSQSGLENALRTEFRKLDRQAIQGRGRYGDLVTGAVEDVSRGTPISNAARWVGRFAPRGVVSTAGGAGVPFYVGNSVGGPAAGAGLAAITMGAGEVGKRASEAMARRQADIASLLARGGQEYADQLDTITNTAATRGGSAATGGISPIIAALLGLTEE